MNAEYLVGRAAREALIAMQAVADARDRLTAVNWLIAEHPHLLTADTSAGRVSKVIAEDVRRAADDLHRTIIRLPASAWAIFAEWPQAVGAHEVIQQINRPILEGVPA